MSMLMKSTARPVITKKQTKQMYLQKTVFHFQKQLVQTAANLAPGFSSVIFLKQVAS